MSETELGPALADAIKHGSYPDSEATASAEVQEAALPEVLRSLTEARDAVKVWSKPTDPSQLPLIFLTLGFRKRLRRSMPSMLAAT